MRTIGMPGRGRQAGLERLRIVATLLVVWLHATIAYLAIPLPGLAWPVHEASGSWAINVSFWWIQCSIMPLFFVLSGMAASHLWLKKTPGDFARHRCLRLGGPLLVGLVLVLPFDMYVWALGWVISGRYELVKLKSLKFSEADAEMFFGLAHLWYLLYLWLISMGMCGWLWVAEGMRARVGRSGLGQSVYFMSGGLCVAYVLAVGLFWMSPRMTLGFRHGFWPHVTHVGYYGIFFVGGWWIARERMVVRQPGVWAVCGGVAFGLAYLCSQRYLESGEVDRWSLLGCALLIPLTACLTVGAAVGWAMRSDRELTARETYVSQMSLWIYLAHHPVIGLLQIALHGVSVPVEAKAVLAVVGSMGFCTWSYRFVRRGLVGRWLYGREMPAYEAMGTKDGSLRIKSEERDWNVEFAGSSRGCGEEVLMPRREDAKKSPGSKPTILQGEGKSVGDSEEVVQTPWGAECDGELGGKERRAA